MFTNLLLNTDSYKSSHYLQYPPGIEHVSSYIESRGGPYDRVLFFGLQAFLLEYLSRPITLADIDEADALFAAHGEPFNRAGWLYVLDAHGGRLPVEISALPEGTHAPVGVPLVQLVNTDPACFWLTSYLETSLLRAVWYPTTVASLSWSVRQVIQAALEATSDDPAGQLPFKLHDFGARGVSSQESAALGGLAHLVAFRGSDTVAGLLAARRWYDEPMAGFSIPAAEHSTITSWGRAREAEAYANMLARFGGPGKIVACVSDSYDIFHAVTSLWGEQLKSQVEASGGTLVVRPDSGDPRTVVRDVMRRLMAAFGSQPNGKGYHVLPACVRLIQGDGVDPSTIQAILNDLRAEKIAADNIAFGMGGALLQKLDRDTCKFAMKASAARINGTWIDVYKDPVTDSGKRSKRGRLAVVESDGALRAVRLEDAPAGADRLVPVFRDGRVLGRTTLAEVRARAEQA